MTNTGRQTPEMTEDVETDETCGRPCDPDHACSNCDEYWIRMKAEGLWDGPGHRWTERGWKDIISHA